MTETKGLSAQHPSSEELQQRIVHRFSTSAPSMTTFAFLAITVTAATASFGVKWAQLAGASGWEAAAWPVALSAVTLQALYCRVRMSPGWYPSWVRWLFEIVASAGIVLIGVGLTLNLRGYPQMMFDEFTSMLVASVPGWAMFLSAVVAATFALAVRPPMPTPAEYVREQHIAAARSQPPRNPFAVALPAPRATD
jgi:hypothetical protein